MAPTADDEQSDAADDAGEDGQTAPPKEVSSKDAFKVYVGGLPFKCGKTAVREHFSKCGEIDWLHMPQDALGRPRGIAFISFWGKASVEAALELNGTYFGEHLLKVNMAADKPAKDKVKGKVKTPKGESQEEPEADEDADAEEPRLSKPKNKLREPAESKPEVDCSEPVKGRAKASSDTSFPSWWGSANGEESAAKSSESSKDRKIFVGGIPFSCTVDTLKKDFGACGPIQQLRMPLADDGSSKGIAFITFSTKPGVEEALKFHGTDYGGCTLEVRMAHEKGEKRKLKGMPRMSGQDRSGEPNPLEIIVKGLPFGTKEDALREWLADCGIIDTLRMPMNRKGKSYGFAFVTFQVAKGVKRALKLSGTEFAGRVCSVEKTGGEQCKQESSAGLAEEEIAGGRKTKKDKKRAAVEAETYAEEEKAAKKAKKRAKAEAD